MADKSDYSQSDKSNKNSFAGVIKAKNGFDVVAGPYSFGALRGCTKKQAEANAVLMAAAPELLDALIAMGKACEELIAERFHHKRAANWAIINDAYMKRTAAIAKASKKL